MAAQLRIRVEPPQQGHQVRPRGSHWFRFVDSARDAAPGVFQYVGGGGGGAEDGAGQGGEDGPLPVNALFRVVAASEPPEAAGEGGGEGAAAEEQAPRPGRRGRRRRRGKRGGRKRTRRRRERREEEAEKAKKAKEEEEAKEEEGRVSISVTPAARSRRLGEDGGDGPSSPRLFRFVHDALHPRPAAGAPGPAPESYAGAIRARPSGQPAFERVAKQAAAMSPAPVAGRKAPAAADGGGGGGGGIGRGSLFRFAGGAGRRGSSPGLRVEVYPRAEVVGAIGPAGAARVAGQAGRLPEGGLFRTVPADELLDGAGQPLLELDTGAAAGSEPASPCLYQYLGTDEAVAIRIVTPSGAGTAAPAPAAPATAEPASPALFQFVGHAEGQLSDGSGLALRVDPAPGGATAGGEAGGEAGRPPASPRLFSFVNETDTSNTDRNGGGLVISVAAPAPEPAPARGRSRRLSALSMSSFNAESDDEGEDDADAAATVAAAAEEPSSPALFRFQDAVAAGGEASNARAAAEAEADAATRRRLDLAAAGIGTSCPTAQHATEAHSSFLGLGHGLLGGPVAAQWAAEHRPGGPAAMVATPSMSVCDLAAAAAAAGGSAAGASTGSLQSSGGGSTWAVRAGSGAEDTSVRDLVESERAYVALLGELEAALREVSSPAGGGALGLTPAMRRSLLCCTPAVVAHARALVASLAACEAPDDALARFAAAAGSLRRAYVPYLAALRWFLTELVGRDELLRNAAFRRHEVRRGRVLTLVTLLYLPLQRLRRYTAHLQEVRRHAVAAGAGALCGGALAEVAAALSCEEAGSLGELDAAACMADLQLRVAGTRAVLLAPGRRLERAAVVRASRGGGLAKRAAALLFDDVLVLARERREGGLRYLTRLVLSRTAAAGRDGADVVLAEGGRERAPVTLSFDSRPEAALWLADFERVAAAAAAAAASGGARRRSGRRRSRAASVMHGASAAASGGRDSRDRAGSM